MRVALAAKGAAASPFVGLNGLFVEGHAVVSGGSVGDTSGMRMTCRSLLLSSAALLVPLSPALAQQEGQPAAPAPAAAPATATAQPADEFGDEEEIVVTGARPRGSVIGDIPPENTLDARDVRATGATNINELLSAIAPQIGSAQGRGGERPVLLLNGQRISSFRELRDIPTEAIQRLDILPEEVALKYGYRADQKVVNIVLRQRFRSTVAQVGAGASTDGGYANGVADLTRLMIQRNGRTTINLHAEGNGMLTEAERDILLTQAPVGGTAEQSQAARSLVGRKRDVRGSATFNRQLSDDVSATLNTELEHVEGRSLIGLNPSLLEPLARNTRSDSAHAGLALNGTTKSQWRWTLTGNADLDRNVTNTDRDNVDFPRERARSTSASGDLTATANGTLFALPAGNASTTLTLAGSTVHLDSSRTRLGVRSATELSRTTGEAGVNFDLPVSRRNRDFSALGNLTLNANAEADQLSDFGTLTTIGAGANWSPAERLSFITSWTREDGAPSINQLGDPVLETPGSRIFDFTTGQTVLVTAITGGNPNLESDSRTVWKLGGYWQPLKDTDLRLRADFVRSTIDRPIATVTATPTVEAAFPGRFVRNGAGQLVSIDLRPINFDEARKDTLRLGFDFSKPLKSRPPSQAVIDQFRRQFGLAPRTAQGANAAGGQQAGARGNTGGQGGGFSGRRGGFGGGGFGGGNARGRLQFSLTDTITLVDKVRIGPGLPELDFLRGDAAGSSGGTPRHRVESQLGYFNNGLGARLSGNWRSGTTVDTLTGDNLRFSPLATFDLRLFANPGDIPEIALKHPWLRGTQVRLEVENLFNSRPRVRDAAGNVPLNYQPGLLDPLGRTIMISFRKLFLPPPSFFRQRIQQERQREQQQAAPTG
jgi:hypothetical protein